MKKEAFFSTVVVVSIMTHAVLKVILPPESDDGIFAHPSDFGANYSVRVVSDTTDSTGTTVAIPLVALPTDYVQQIEVSELRQLPPLLLENLDTQSFFDGIA